MDKGNIRNVHGWINLDKPKGMSSAKAVFIVKKILNVKKVGHAGTLDPLATGVLPIAVGEATKTIAFVVEMQKSYRCIASWGSETSTDDVEGKGINFSNKRPNEEHIKSSLKNFKGTINQRPPNFSAVKVNGERAYKIARLGKEPELSIREVKVLKFKLEKIINKDTSDFSIKCEKGTYIRSLIRDLGRDLEVFAHVKDLRRTSVGIFLVKNSISLEQLEKVAQSVAEKRVILPIHAPLSKLSVINLKKSYSEKIVNGIQIPVKEILGKNLESELYNGDLIIAQYENVPIAICFFEKGNLKPKRVFNI